MKTPITTLYALTLYRAGTLGDADLSREIVKAHVALRAIAFARVPIDDDRATFWMIRLDAMTEVAVDRGLGGPPWTPPPTSTTTRRATP